MDQLIDVKDIPLSISVLKYRLLGRGGDHNLLVGEALKNLQDTQKRLVTVALEALAIIDNLGELTGELVELTSVLGLPKEAVQSIRVMQERLEKLVSDANDQ